MFRLSDQTRMAGARWGMGGGGLKGEASIVHFEPVNRTTVSGQIVDQIKSMVRSGNLTPGDKFPSERQLSELLKAGRSSIREAIKVLETIGLIQRNRGNLDGVHFRRKSRCRQFLKTERRKRKCRLKT